MSWSVAGLLGLLKRGPIIVDMLWKTSEYVAGNGSPGHMVAVDAVVSDNGSDGVWTHLRILDPWPPGRGRVYWVNYNDWMTDVPTRTYRIFERA